ncbi:serine dehydratase subunit alpha family protein [Campylobacter canadensis]|uniref:Serine dehydratase subunit alpha family protein n=1 Tax=Campylobacter canadensis TaxID=449520 RepID=A0ABS7WP67_9BACT|nr:L-serine ammonia-lyase, iron-sulfur-dependent, subunit alpha [Campylobacter canadensis]MBZ7986564.1 serine dehydratase subunit alpha family protein [Campylobacter canadensis]MBZ7994031.1 serine dehydratase subunit alpha family protein [Campylobacter canadensis]MBZ7995966.1 serine dehydratase subunit alpha family protein [Campylobacter canadensis]MBZ7999362.1 serine dehydratase subunit alpha family protein [Campylobacter canadensis]MBZ8001159.1 serine dehydratase subunit alpha family protein
MNYEKLLKNELLKSYGCTEPIALAYAAARISSLLNEDLEQMQLFCSSNIIKNVNSVVIPNTNYKKGIEVAAAIGYIVKKYEDKLELLKNVKDEDIEQIDDLCKKITVNLEVGVPNLFIKIIAYTKNNKAQIIIVNEHTNIAYLSLNDKLLIDTYKNSVEEEYRLDFDDIYTYCKLANLDNVKDLLKEQYELNYKIAQEGIKNNYGANIGKLMLSSTKNESLAYACAGSDARMSGSALSVMIVSGSGNQGICASVPVYLHAKKINASEDELIKALAFSNLITLYLKSKIGKLSAYCGVVSAASAAICAIAMLDKQDKKVIERCLINSLAISSGIFCDGAKASCAAKIASALNSAFLAYEQAKSNNNFNFNDGIIKNNLQNTVDAICNVARYGMAQTDVVILEQMLKKDKQ